MQGMSMSVFGRRLKEARLRAGLSQEQLGIEAGLDPMSASTRMNRYELGKRAPNFELAEELAKVLEVPTSYFYATDDSVAKLIISFGALSAKDRVKALNLIEAMLG
jgi:transcriptional regulator with XRE-family HTH domain